MCSEEATNEVADAMKGGAAAPNSNTQATTADPVNIVTGAFLQTETDLKIPCGRLSLEFTRHYDSGHHNESILVGPMGLGWTHSYNLVLNVDNPLAPIYTDDRFSKTSFVLDESRQKNFVPVKRSGVELYSRDFGFTLRQGDGLEAHFSNEGKLLRFLRPGPKLDVTIDLDYDDSSRLSRICGLGGRELRLGYEGSSNLVSVLADHTGREWRYTYSDDVLVRVERPDRAIIEYEYAAQGVRVASARRQTKQRKVVGMTSVYLPRLPSEDKVAMVTNRYTSEGRVHEQTDALGNVTAFDYNLFTRTTCVTDPAGFTTVYCYDEAGNTVKMRRPEGGVRLWEFDDKRNLLAETDGLGNSVQYAEQEYSPSLSELAFLRRAISCWTRSPSSQSLSHDIWGNRAIVRYSDTGSSFRFFNYRNGIPSKILVSDGSVIEFCFDERSGLPLRKLHLGEEGSSLETTWKYDDYGNVVKKTQQMRTHDQLSSLKRVWEFGYNSGHDQAHRCEWVSDSDSDNVIKNRCEKVFNSLGLPISETRFVVSRGGGVRECTRKFGYDCLSRPIWSSNARGWYKIFVLDSRGNLIEEHRSVLKNDGNDSLKLIGRDSLHKLLRYDNRGLMISKEYSDGATTHFHHDERGLLTKIAHPLGCISQFKYDRNGNRCNSVHPNGMIIDFTFDHCDKELTVSNSAGKVVRFQRNQRGQVEKIMEDTVEGETVCTEFIHDVYGRITRLIYSDCSSVWFSYNLAGKLTSRLVKSHTGEVASETRNEYDCAGRLVCVSDGVGLESSALIRINYDNDSGGFLIKDGEGFCTSCEVDSLQRVIAKTFDDGLQIQIEYDAEGNIIRRTSKGIDQRLDYSPEGRLVSTSEGDVLNQWEFNKIGLVVSHVQRVGTISRRLQYEYDAARRLCRTSVDDINHSFFEYEPNRPFLRAARLQDNHIRFKYDCCGRLASESSGNTLVSWCYDCHGNIREHSVAESGKLIFFTSCTRDRRMRPKFENVRTPSGEATYLFSYDCCNRLARIQSDNRCIELEYDTRGNRTRMRRNGKVCLEARYSASNRVISLSNLAKESLDFEYDCRGNRLKGNGELSHDVFGRLRRVDSREGTTHFDYSPTGDLVCISSNAEKNTLFYDGPHIMESVRRDRSTFFLWRSSVDGLRAIIDDRGTQFAKCDLRGSVFDHDDDGYGILGIIRRNTEDSCEARFAFAGKLCDTNTGYHWSRMRWLDPETGCFIEPDPIGFLDGANLYQFAHGNPTTYADAFGLLATNASFAFSQSTVSVNFSEAGDFVGMSVYAVSQAIVANLVSPSEIEVQYVVTPQANLFVNTRSALALMAADVAMNEWNLVDVTNEPLGYGPNPTMTYSEMIAERLSENGLTQAGTPAVEATGWR